MTLRRLALAFVMIAAPSHAFAAEGFACVSGDGYVARAVEGEVAGADEYRENLGNGWTFALDPAPHGWDLRVFDSNGADITAYTPPYRFVPNPREIYGWHFRNADNTGPNEGSVNAPQRQRDFVLAPALAAAGINPLEVDTTDPATFENLGRGVLNIVDFELDDLEQGVRARMVRLVFDACLAWPDGADAAHTEVTPEEIEIFGACGLAPPLALDPYLTPHVIDGDFDGDGAFDHVATIIRMSDGKRGIAFCHAGTWLDVIGLDGDLGDLTPDYFDLMDYWVLNPRGPIPESPFADGPVPIASGETITIGVSETSSVLLYWDGSQFQSYWQGD